MSKLSLLLEVKKLTEAFAKSIRLKMSAPHTIKGQGTFEVIATTASLDRDGEVLTIEGWEFDNYMQNPVILWSHDLYSLPLGAVTDLRVEDGKVIVQGVFADTEEGQKVRKLYEDGILRTVSVGYIPKQRQGNAITVKELYEVSFVSVPANPDAMDARKRKAIKSVEELVVDSSKAISTKAQDKEEDKEKAEQTEETEDAKDDDNKETVVDVVHEENGEVAEVETNVDNGANQDDAEKGTHKSVSAVYPKSTETVKPHAKANQVESKSGRVLSSKNIVAMQETMAEIAVCMTGMQKCSNMLQAIIDSAGNDKGIAQEKANLKELQTMDKMLERLIVSTKQNLKSANHSK